MSSFAPSEAPRERISDGANVKLSMLAERIQREDPASAERLLSSGGDKTNVLQRLRELKTLAERSQLRSATSAEITALLDEVEDATLVSTRPVEDAVAKGMTAFQELPSGVKQATFVGGGMLGALGLYKLWNGAMNRVNAGASRVKNGASAAVTSVSNFGKWLFKTAATAGVTILTFMGVQKFLEKGNQNPS